MTTSEAAGANSSCDRDAVQHVVRAGDCLTALSARYGVLPEAIWKHEGNASLRSARASGRVLEPGDVLVIPPLRVAKVARPSGQRHRFVRKGGTARLKLQLRREGEVRPDLEYTLAIDARPVVEGRTDAEGRIDHPIPPGAQRGVLTILEDGERIELRLGHLDPERSPRGAQSRLRHLGFYGGRVDGQIGALTAASLIAFQRAHGLEESGELDGPTSERLREAHGA